MVMHPIIVRAPKAFSASAGPLLLQRTDARFMANVRSELANPERWAALKHTIVQPTSTPLRLFQPIHRTFYVSLIEVVCDTPGQPALDPAKIDSAGLVIRRVQRARAGQSQRVNQAWLQLEDGSAGWSQLAESAHDPRRLGSEADPDAARRRVRSTGNAEIDRRLALLRSEPRQLSETVIDLFTLPAAVATATRATLLFGLLPTASLATSGAAPSAEYDDAEVLQDYPPFLQAQPGVSLKLPSEGDVLRRPTAQPARDSLLGKYTTFLQQLVIQYDLLGDTPAARKLRAELDKILLPFPSASSRRSKKLGEHLVEAAHVLVLGPNDGGTNSLHMPGAWVSPSEAQARAILDAIKTTLRQRVDGLQREQSQFGTPGDRYVARAFVRVRRDDGCPPELVWSQSSAEYEIAPWFDSGPGSMPVVQLPDPAQGLKKFKPNVAFALPASIVDVVRDNAPDALLDGKGNKGNNLGIAWLCGFNIPLITLCAFIVLSIFLSLLNIIFWWLPFIKICIPIPKRQS